jgi:hypothetical protein
MSQTGKGIYVFKKMAGLVLQGGTEALFYVSDLNKTSECKNHQILIYQEMLQTNKRRDSKRSFPYTENINRNVSHKPVEEH